MMEWLPQALPAIGQRKRSGRRLACGLAGLTPSRRPPVALRPVCAVGLSCAVGGVEYARLGARPSRMLPASARHGERAAEQSSCAAHADEAHQVPRGPISLIALCAQRHNKLKVAWSHAEQPAGCTAARCGIPPLRQHSAAQSRGGCGRWRHVVVVSQNVSGRDGQLQRAIRVRCLSPACAISRARMRVRTVCQYAFGELTRSGVANNAMFLRASARGSSAFPPQPTTT